jgi:predicted DNA-binding transcriptional regulator
MNKDQGIGAVLLAGSIVGIALYAWLVYSYAVLVLQITAFIAVAAILVILAWIGWTMATTPSPAPLELETISTPPAASANPQEKPSQTTDKT